MNEQQMHTILVNLRRSASLRLVHTPPILGAQISELQVQYAVDKPDTWTAFDKITALAKEYF